MTDAYIYDHVRSPRGKGRPNGSLHEVTPVDLLSQVLVSLRDRSELDTGKVDDVVMGCVSPVGEQGACIARTAVLNANYSEDVPGKQLNRFCASGLEAVNTAAAHDQVQLGLGCTMVVGGQRRVVCPACPMGSDGGAICIADPKRLPTTAWTSCRRASSADLIATLEGFSIARTVDAFAVNSQESGGRRESRMGQAVISRASVVPVKDQSRSDHCWITTMTHSHGRRTTVDEPVGPAAFAFAMMPGTQMGFDTVAHAEVSGRREGQPRAHTPPIRVRHSGWRGGWCLLGSARTKGEAVGPASRVRAFAVPPRWWAPSRPSC